MKNLPRNKLGLSQKSSADKKVKVAGLLNQHCNSSYTTTPYKWLWTKNENTVLDAPPACTCVHLFPPSSTYVMSTFVHLCPPVSTCVQLGPPMSTYVDLCQPASSFVHLRPPASTCVHLYLLANYFQLWYL